MRIPRKIKKACKSFAKGAPANTKRIRYVIQQVADYYTYVKYSSTLILPKGIDSRRGEVLANAISMFAESYTDGLIALRRIWLKVNKQKIFENED